MPPTTPTPADGYLALTPAHQAEVIRLQLLELEAAHLAHTMTLARRRTLAELDPEQYGEQVAIDEKRLEQLAAELSVVRAAYAAVQPADEPDS